METAGAPMAAQPPQPAATELETLVRGIGSELATVLADRLREDAADSRLLGRPPPRWNGNAEDWPMWNQRLEAFARRLKAAEELTQAEDQEPTTLELTHFSEEAQNKARKLYDLFTDTLDGKPALIFKTCEKGNGFQVWSKLHREYEARLAGRYQGMLTALMHPEGWKGLDDVKFAEAYLKWQGDVLQYELQRRKTIENDVKVAVSNLTRSGTTTTSWTRS